MDISMFLKENKKKLHPACKAGVTPFIACIVSHIIDLSNYILRWREDD
jgi:hypothetical protein